MNVPLTPAFLLGAGLDEWALLGVIAFLLFGPKRLPEIARTIGRTLEKIRRAADDFRQQVEHLDDPPQPVVPRPVFPVAAKDTAASLNAPSTQEAAPVVPSSTPHPGA